MKFYTQPSHPCFFPGSRSRCHHLFFFRFNGVVELGRGVFGFCHALRPLALPVGPDPRLWGHILLFVLTPIMPLCTLL